MSFLGRNTFKFAGVTFPLPTSTGNPLVLDADPSITFILLFLAAVINKYQGARWLEAATGANLNDAAGNLITQPVVQTVPYSPADYLQDEQFHFPLLSLDRISFTAEEKTREYYQITTKLQLLYMLPPMDPGQMVQINSFRNAVQATILDRLMLGFDPSFMSNVSDGVLYQIAGYEALSVVGGNWIGIQNPNTNTSANLKKINTFFPTLMMELELRERQNPISGQFPPLQFVDGYVSSGDGYAPNNFNLDLFHLNLPQG